MLFLYLRKKTFFLDTPSKMTRFTDCLGKSAQDRDGGESRVSKQCQLSRNPEDKIRHYLLTNQQRLYRNCNRFTPQIMNSAFEVDIADMFTELVLLQSNTKKAGDKHQSKPITLKDLSQIFESTPGGRVLMSGEGGIGKTTLLRYVSYNWATKTSFDIFKGKILFLINIRDLDKDQTILDLILKEFELDDFSLETDLAEDPRLIKKFIMDHPDEIVLLLDGLDELRFQNKSPLRLFKKQRLERSSVVVTSRSINIDEYIKNSNLHVQIKGFDKKNVTKYITRYFEQVEKPELGDSLVEQLKVTAVAYQMCKNPMLLLSICFMWEEEQHLATDKADLFKAFFLCILNQFNRKDNSYKIPAFENIPEEYLTSMLLLGKCMYHGLKNNQLSFIKTDLHTIAIRDKVDDTLALKLGFVYEDKTHSKKSKLAKTFTAPHKLIVESLVGFYLYKLCEISRSATENKNNKLLLSMLEDGEWENIRENDFIMAREFAIGFLGAGAAKLLKHWITNRFSTYRSLILLLKQVVNEKHLKDVENDLMDYVTKTKLDIQFTSVCNSLRMFLTYHTPNVSVDTNNVFYLMRKVHDILEPTINQNFCDNISSQEKRQVLFHSLIAVSKPGCLLQSIHEDCMNYIVEECEKHNIKYDIYDHTIYQMPKTTAEYLLHILTNSPKLQNVIANPNTITGTVLNDMVSQCCSKSAQSSEVIHTILPRFSQLTSLNMNNNDLSHIDGASLGYLLCMSPVLRNIHIYKCNLSGNVMNDMFIECSSRGVTLGLEKLDISNNDLSEMNGSSLAYFINTRHIFRLDMNNCKLSSKVMNDMLKCSSGITTRGLMFLNISYNNLRQIDGILFRNFIRFSHKLAYLRMGDCCLTSWVIDSMFWGHIGFVLHLYELDISGNDLYSIDSATLKSLMNSLTNLKMQRCHLPNRMFINFKNGNHNWFSFRNLSALDISGNYFWPPIDNAKLISFISVFPSLRIFNADNVWSNNVFRSECSRRHISLGPFGGIPF
ncbi:NACHT, LRR and PYD domains-containing protein 3-like [Antedon mediterranea]|uniref:NACHT, LRR and PYD domains-containing protein 3-like n=1 Tax=Antedon mediterranea TaxID=105859 RepID=UPI003AF629A7